MGGTISSGRTTTVLRAAARSTDDDDDSIGLPLPRRHNRTQAHANERSAACRPQLTPTRWQ